MKTEHTPLPWYYGKNSQEIWCEGGGKTVAKVGYGNSPIPRFPAEKVEEDENGAFIVEACNNYDRLKAANAEMLELLKSFAPLKENGALDHIWSALMSHQERHYADALSQWGNEARAAIKKAEEL